MGSKQPQKRTKEEERKSLKRVLKYAKQECWSWIIGMGYLWLACVSEFVVPLYIGYVINALEKGEFDKIGALCYQLFIIIVVSIILAR